MFGTPTKASRLRSRLSQRDGQLRERIGPVHFRFVLHTWDGTIFWNVTGGRLLGVLPLPAALFRDIRCSEREVDGRYVFDVEAALPLAGHVVRYHGWLRPEGDAAA